MNPKFLHRILYVYGSIVAAELFSLLSCGTTGPNDNSDPVQVIRGEDPRLEGIWEDYDDQNTNVNKTVINFELRNKSFNWDTYSHSSISDTSPEYSKSEYLTGTWRVSNDTIFLSCDHHLIVKDGNTGKMKDTLISAGQVLHCNYFINGSGKLVISRFGYPWSHYSRQSTGIQGVLSDSLFTAVAPSDTQLSILDTIRLKAGSINGTAEIKMYIWSFDGGKTYGDTTDTDEIKLYMKMNNVRSYIAAVRAVDSENRISVPDYFEFDVHTYRPQVSFRDTILINDDTASWYIRAVATDTNGTISRYVWALNSGTFMDTTKEGLYALGNLSMSENTISVAAIDNNGLISNTVECRIKIVPARYYGTAKDETGEAVTCIGDKIVLAGNEDKGGFYQTFVGTTIIDPSGNALDHSIGFVASDSGNYKMFGVKGIVPTQNGGFAVCGSMDDSYSVLNYGFLISYNETMERQWSVKLRDTSAIGTGISDMATTEDGMFVLAGSSWFETCVPIDSTTSSCSYYMKPFMACVDKNGSVRRQFSFPHPSKSYEMRTCVAVLGTNDFLLGFDSLLIKTDGDENELWNINMHVRINDIVSPDGSTAWILTSNFSGLEVALVSVTNQGVIGQSHPVTGVNSPVSLLLLRDKSLVIIARNTLSHVTENGVLLWQNTYGAFSLSGAVQDEKGDIIVSGSTKDFGAGGSDAVLLKLNMNGKRIW